MTRIEMAFAVMDYMPLGVIEQIVEIGKSRSSRRVEMNFKDGRCLEIKVTNTERYTSDDFEEGAES